MQIELTQEEQSAVFLLAVGELQAIKTEQIMGEPVDQHEIETLYAVAHKTNPDPAQVIPVWDALPALDPEEDEPGTIGHIPV